MVRGELSERMGLRLLAEEMRVIEAVSEETGLSVSDVVRQAIRKAYADKFKQQAKPKSKR